MPKCEQCGAKFETPQGLKMHTVRKHSAKGKRWSTTKGKRVKRSKPHDAAELEINYCPRCGLNFRALGVKR